MQVQSTVKSQMHVPAISTFRHTTQMSLVTDNSCDAYSPPVAHGRTISQIQRPTQEKE